LGREELAGVTLTPGQWLPFDRLWAVEHADARPGEGWRAKANFLRGSDRTGAHGGDGLA
jgi:uncharacterized protein